MAAQENQSGPGETYPTKGAFQSTRGAPASFCIGPESADTAPRYIVILLIIVLIILFAGGGGYWGHAQWGPQGGLGIGAGTILLIILICYLLGLLR